jgi:hypothetical protein
MTTHDAPSAPHRIALLSLIIRFAVLVAVDCSAPAGPGSAIDAGAPTPSPFAPSRDAGEDEGGARCRRAGARCTVDDDCCYAGCIDGVCACGRRYALCGATSDCCAGHGDCVDGFCGWTER